MDSFNSSRQGIQIMTTNIGYISATAWWICVLAFLGAVVLSLGPDDEVLDLVGAPVVEVMK